MTTQDFSEDEEILEALTDPVDVEAFRNLMDNAHGKDQSAASFIREDPERTSRAAIRKLCLKEKRRFLSDFLGGFFRRRWKGQVG